MLKPWDEIYSCYVMTDKGKWYIMSNCREWDARLGIPLHIKLMAKAPIENGRLSEFQVPIPKGAMPLYQRQCSGDTHQGVTKRDHLIGFIIDKTAYEFIIPEKGKEVGFRARKLKK